MVEEHLINSGNSWFTNNLCYGNARGFYMGPGTNTHVVSGLIVKNNNFINNINSGIGIDGGNGTANGHEGTRMGRGKANNQ